MRNFYHHFNHKTSNIVANVLGVLLFLLIAYTLPNLAIGIYVVMNIIATSLYFNDPTLIFYKHYWIILTFFPWFCLILVSGSCLIVFILNFIFSTSKLIYKSYERGIERIEDEIREHESRKNET